MKSQGNEPASFSSPETQENVVEIGGGTSSINVPPEKEELIYDVELLPHDPGKRMNIMDYPPNKRNAVRRAYILKKPCQPKTHNFPQRQVGGLRRFSVNWFNKWDWLEKWNNSKRFENHVGGIKSAHNLSYEKFLLGRGLAFRGHDESDESHNRGNFIELLKWLGEKVKEVGDHTLENAPENCQMTTPPIQKDIINCYAKETTKCIIEDIGDDYFAILVDESSDVSQKEQLALVFALC
ncbi:uncharacterized protein LOC110704726 [Chenopodium quinoa]|uniref:uncharacterized protein LOC110704726 n=1 Tax=Chenopodium quinoa TaxID=63459 RepID=UPI000B781EF2|nr:uncharacterized protein LOC110704726 [Chenopodium quinoa]